MPLQDGEDTHRVRLERDNGTFDGVAISLGFVSEVEPVEPAGVLQGVVVIDEVASSMSCFSRSSPKDRVASPSFLTGSNVV